MPKKKQPPKSETEEEDIEVTENRENENPEEKIEVSLSEKEKKEDDYKDRFEKQLEEFKKERKRSEFLNRKLEKLLAEKSYDRNDKQVQPENPYLSKKDVSEFKDNEVDALTPDQIEEIAQRNWQLAVDLKAQKVFRQTKQRELLEQKQISTAQQLEQSKNLVRERYPTIEDGTSEESKLYIEVLNENPHLLSNISGPELAMYKMEEKMRQQGIQPPAYRRQYMSDVNQEVQRRERIGAGSIPHGSPASGDKVMLTQEQIDFAKQSGIPLKKFAHSYKLQPKDFKEGVTVDDDEQI